MTTEEQLVDLRKRYEEGEKGRLREKYAATMMVGFISIIALSALVYAFFQKTQNGRAKFQAERDKILCEEQVADIRKQLLVEIERSAACEKKLAKVEK